MEPCRIIDYAVEWRDKFRTYLQQTFPSYTKAYIDYCIDCSSGRVPSKIVLDENDKIVGCQLYYCTTVMIKDEEMPTHWGHDTYLDKEYRGTFGLDFVLYLNQFKGFGLGLTSVNNKILTKQKKRFLDGVYTYYLINCFLPLSPFQRLFGITPQLYDKEILKVGRYVFRRIYDAKDMTIPNRGYWLKDIFDVDFIRDESFLNKRFIQNNVHKYLLYSMENEGEKCYFIVRKTRYHGVPAVTLCDFRYNNPDLVNVILKAFRKIAIKSTVGVLLFVCGDTFVEKCVSKTVNYKSHLDFVVNKKVSSDMSFCITGADSDADFLKE